MRRLWQYLQFFFFVAFNFNPLLAVCLLWDEIRGERKYGLNTTGIRNVQKQASEEMDRQEINLYMPSNYVLLEKAFAEINRYPHNATFLDVGCGRGRPLVVAAHHGFRKLVGVDFVPAFCKETEEVLTKKLLQFPAAIFRIECMDATSFALPDDVQTIYFYNPFGRNVMREMIAKINASWNAAPRTIFIVYLNPVYKSDFLEEGFQAIYKTKRFFYLEASVLRKEG